MAVQPLWVVAPAYNPDLFSTKRSHLWLLQNQIDLGNLAFFGSESNAIEFAKNRVAVNGGVELAVYQATSHFFAQPAEVKQKKWKGKELIPV
jgi:hypothetical protein